MPNACGNPVSQSGQQPAPDQRVADQARREVDDRKNLSDDETPTPLKKSLVPDNPSMKNFSLRGVSIIMVVAASLMLASCYTPSPVPAGDRQVLACTLPGSCVDSLGMGGLAPLKYHGTAAQAQQRLEATLKTFSEAQIVHRDALAMQVIFTTPAGFRDQVDFQINPVAESIDFRSRSLFGLFDFGKNRSRMQEFVQRFQTTA